ncbi:MAG: transcription initiation protein [Candidatus Dormibacteraeota bacterium]|nr:transcription initiation protein [Candidatus Dormibacteraeota bacterium]
MKYAMVIHRTEEHRDLPSEAEVDFDVVVRWWADLRARRKVVASAALGPAGDTTSVSWRDREPIVTDGPYIEAKEAVGGFVVLEVESLEEAVEIASGWPMKTGLRIELRPVVEGETRPFIGA